MKKSLLYLIVLTLFIACNEPSNTTQVDQQQEQSEQIEEQEIVLEIINQEGLYGFYIGDFVASEYKENKKPSYLNKINISIDEIKEKKVEGHSVLAGNSRPFSGTITKTTEGFYEVTAEEPGDNKYDGNFSFTIDSEKKEIVGTWEAFDKTLAVTKRKYKLIKRHFEYDKDLMLPEESLYSPLYENQDESEFNSELETLTEMVLELNASNTVLKKEDVENLYKADLEVIRNTIYAKHGYTFQNRKMRYFFDSIDWYIPVYTDVTNQLTDLEKKNIDLLKRYEAHSERYYDMFGR